jgi:dolichol-phosphate mannosyltransferase
MATARTRRPVVTIVTPVFNESQNLPRYERDVRDKLLACTDIAFEVLFVEDGSRDGSWQAIQAICQRDRRFRGLRLSRNFGSHVALCAGLQHADGDAVVVLACDLQDPPEVVLEFVRRWQAGARIVWGKRRSRADAGWRVLTSRLFEGMLRHYALPRGSLFATGTFLLLDRKVVLCYREFQETNRITFALVAWTGFEQDVVEYDRQARQAGKSAWKLKHMIKAGYDAFLSFSKVPFGLVTGVGIFLFLLSIPLTLYLILCYLTGDPKPGWVSIMLCLALFFGIQFIFMSIQGEYLSRIYSEAVRRPLFFISNSTDVVEEEFHEAV